MSTKWQRVRLNIPDAYTPAEREIIAEEVIDFIRERVQGKGLDKNNRKFKAYSEAYVKSLNFKIAGKSKGDVNLTLSGDTLGAMTLLSHEAGSILIGFKNGTPENAIADGNIRGTYGKPNPIPGRARDFLGLTKSDLSRILAKHPLDDSSGRQQEQDIQNASRGQGPSKGITTDIGDEGDNGE